MDKDKRIFVVFERIYYGLVGDTYEDVPVYFTEDKEKAKKIKGSDKDRNIIPMSLDKEYDVRSVRKRLPCLRFDE